METDLARNLSAEWKTLRFFLGVVIFIIALQPLAAVVIAVLDPEGIRDLSIFHFLAAVPFAFWWAGIFAWPFGLHRYHPKPFAGFRRTMWLPALTGILVGPCWYFLARAMSAQDQTLEPKLLPLIAIGIIAGAPSSVFFAYMVLAVGRSSLGDRFRIAGNTGYDGG